MAGKPESGTTILQADGLEHGVSPQAPGVVAVTRWIGAHVLETTASKDGRSMGRARYAVSDDGRTLRATVEGVDPAGKAFDQVIVFDRHGERGHHGSEKLTGLTSRWMRGRDQRHTKRRRTTRTTR